MPLYDYECRACKNFFEALVRPGSGTPSVRPVTVRISSVSSRRS